MNQSYACMNAPYAYAHAPVRCSECNCTKIMHARYFCVFWVSSMQICCTMRSVWISYKHLQLLKLCNPVTLLYTGLKNMFHFQWRWPNFSQKWTKSTICISLNKQLEDKNFVMFLNVLVRNFTIWPVSIFSCNFIYERITYPNKDLNIGTLLRQEISFFLSPTFSSNHGNSFCTLGDILVLKWGLCFCEIKLCISLTFC